LLIHNNDSLDWLHHVRAFELRNTLRFVGVGLSSKSILEIGSGTGFQLKILKQYGSLVVGIDLKSSPYQERVTQIILYDGQHMPFRASSFDIVISSNVLEHIKDISSFQSEIKRVLKKNGLCVHILPSHYWRFWSSLFHYPWICLFTIQIILKFLTRGSNRCSAGKNKFTRGYRQATKMTPVSKDIGFLKAFRTVIAPQRHGARGNFITELFYFCPLWWKRHFIENGWHVITVFGTGLFYWSHDLARFKLPISFREVLSKYLGSACYSFILRKADPSGR